jgi:Chalcone isomerase-like
LKKNVSSGMPGAMHRRNAVQEETKMKRYRTIALAVLGLCAAVGLATEVVGVSGSSIQFATPIETQVGNEQVKLVLTGTALRKKLVFNVYAIGSYLREGVAVRSAEELAAVDCLKRLHLVMERDVPGKDMAEAFRAAIRQNYAAPAFDAEVKSLGDCLQANEARKGDHIWLTHLPNVGLHVQLVGKANLVIQNPSFARAVWDIYLGKNNLGDAIKKGLVSRL